MKLLKFGKQRGKGYGGRPRANCRCNNAPAETKDSGDFCRRFSARAEERKDGLEIETPFKEAFSKR